MHAWACIPKVHFNWAVVRFYSYPESMSRLRMVLKSMGFLMIFLYVGNCLVLTGSKKGQASSWFSKSSKSCLHGAISFTNFFPDALSFFAVCCRGGGDSGAASSCVTGLNTSEQLLVIVFCYIIISMYM